MIASVNGNADENPQKNGALPVCDAGPGGQRKFGRKKTGALALRRLFLLR
jgi:hypothetical protein